jgi:DNA-binding winged helix-turn-helix (wHTH) protein
MARSDIDNPSTRFEFGRCQIDRGRRCLLIDGREVPLRPDSWTVLERLASNPGRELSREALIEAAWPGLLVTEATLADHIEELRRVFGEYGPGLIAATPEGYRFDPEAAPPERRGTRGPHPLRWRWNYGIFIPLATAIVFLLIWWATRDAD